MPLDQAITYNGVTLNLVHTNNIDATAVMSDDGVDYLYTEVTIDVDAIIAPGVTSYTGVPGGIPSKSNNALPPVSYAAIRHALLRPRGTLSFKNFNTAMFSVPSNRFSDAKNGPTPVRVNIKEIDGGKVFHINYVIKFFINDCSSSIIQPWVSHRFSQSQSIDENHLTVVVTQGKAIFRVDFLDSAGLVADSFRNQLLPPINPGFRREKIDFGVDSARNAITYSVVDKESTYDLGDTSENGSGSFITKFDGVFKTMTNRMSGGSGPVNVPSPITTVMASVRLWGSKRASVANLWQYAFAALASSGKMGFGARFTDRFIVQIDISQSLVDRYVELTVVQQVMVKAGAAAPIDIYGLMVDDVSGKFGGINPVPPNDNGSRGTAAFLALSSALTTTCSTPPRMVCNVPADTGGSGANGLQLGRSTPAYTQYCGGPPAVSVAPIEMLPSSQSVFNRYSPPYTETSSESRFFDMSGNAFTLKAIGRPPAAQNPQAGGITTTPAGQNNGSTSTGSNSNTFQTSAKKSPGNSPGNSPSNTGVKNEYVTLHYPCTIEEYTWSCERIHVPPQIPAPTSGDGNKVLIASEISMLDVQSYWDGTPVFCISGKYRYLWQMGLADTVAVSFPTSQSYSYNYRDYGIDTQSSLINGMDDPGNGPTY